MFIESEPTRILEYFTGTRRPKIFEKDIVTTFTHNGTEVQDTTTVLVVLSTHHDNPYLTTTQRASIEVLRTTDPEKYKQLGEARFIKSSGSFFHEFNKEIHVVEPFVIPPTWTRYRSIDYGLDMLAVLWFAVSPTNEVYVYKELHESDRIISDAARRILEVNGTDSIRLTYAPPDLWSRTKDTGKSIQETFMAHGVPFYRSSNARIEGWLAVKEAIKIITTKDVHTGAEYKTSNLRIFSNCANLIKNIATIQRDEKEPNDCADTPHDITHVCLSGDTIVCLDNRNIKIKDMVGTTGMVKCYDTINNVETVSKYYNVHITDDESEVISIEFENGDVVKCTGNHPFLTNLGWVNAIDLTDKHDIITI